MPAAWGTGRMAAGMALARESRRAAVIGCGAVGLTAARRFAARPGKRGREQSNRQEASR